MTRYLVRLVVIGLVIVGTGLIIMGLGYSGTAVVLGMLLAAALSWVPTLLAIEGLQQDRVRRDGGRRG